MARRFARLMPYYGYSDDRFFTRDGAPAGVAANCRAGFERLSAAFRAASPRSIEASRQLEEPISDVSVTKNYRVPFQYRTYAREHLQVGALVDASQGTRVRDLDGNWAYDISGSDGVNVFGYDFYRRCVDEGVDQVRGLGPVLGPNHREAGQ